MTNLNPCSPEERHHEWEILGINSNQEPTLVRCQICLQEVSGKEEAERAVRRDGLANAWNRYREIKEEIRAGK